MAIKIILVGFILFVLWGNIKRYRKRELSGKELFLWSILWLMMTVAILIPQTTDLLASSVGVGRGLDLVVVISIVTLFYILFKLISKIERMERDITSLVRTIAINENNKTKDKTHP
jgi:hypothetical protein